MVNDILKSTSVKKIIDRSVPIPSNNNFEDISGKIEALYSEFHIMNVDFSGHHDV